MLGREEMVTVTLPVKRWRLLYSYALESVSRMVVEGVPCEYIRRALDELLVPLRLAGRISDHETESHIRQVTSCPVPLEDLARARAAVQSHTLNPIRN